MYLSASAEDDLDAIGQFIIDNGGHPLDVVSFLKRIQSRCMKIGDAPHGYPIRKDLGFDIRIVPFERSVTILYHLQGEAVEILNVIYGGQDFEALFQGYSKGD